MQSDTVARYDSGMTQAAGTPIHHHPTITGTTLNPAATCRTCDWTLTGHSLQRTTDEAAGHALLRTTPAERANHWRREAAIDALAALASRS